MDKRKIAVDLLVKAETDDSYINISLDNALQKATPADRPFITRLVNGVTERKITIDYYIATLAKRSVAEIDIYPLSILRSAIFQLLYMNTAEYAVVNESVGMCKNRGEGGFVNAILRRLLREGAPPLPPIEKNKMRHLSVKHSFPTELCRFFVNSFGWEKTEEYFGYFNSVPPLTLRVNTKKITPEAFIEKIGGAARSPICESAIVISDGAAVRELYGYEDGLFFVQDVSSQIAVLALGARMGARVVDVCAAPGGKSLGIALQMGGVGEIFSFDIHESKLSLINKNAKRLGIDIIHTGARDAALLPDADMEESADFVMCDVPCSGLGVLGKKADMRYRHTGSLEALPPLQLSIISSASRYLKRGGEMVYSTCTINSDENERVVESFLGQNSEFSLVPFKIGALSSDGMYTFFPNEMGTDGFFIAKIRRN